MILTGYLDDGTAGLWTVKERGGTTIVQDPADAAADPMPRSALKHVEVDHCVRLVQIPVVAREADAESRPRNGLKRYLNP